MPGGGGVGTAQLPRHGTFYFVFHLSYCNNACFCCHDMLDRAIWSTRSHYELIYAAWYYIDLEWF
jgi:hypothetical protein